MRVNSATFERLRRLYYRDKDHAEDATTLLAAALGIGRGAAIRRFEGGRRIKSYNGIRKRSPIHGPTFRYRITDVPR